MKRRVFKDPYPNTRQRDYPDDVQRLRVVAATLGGVRLDPEDAVRVWEAYSDSYAAGWLSMHHYRDDDLWDAIRQYTEEVDA